MESAIKVVVRIRPSSAVEEKFEQSISVADESQVNLGNIKSFTFDRVYDKKTSQNQFQELVFPVIDRFIEGFNGTIIAYGQTGSGKTYTMGTNYDPTLDRDKYGIIPRSCVQIMNMLENKCSDEKENNSITKKSTRVGWELCCQFLELYNEDINDLLSPVKNSKVLKITEDVMGSVMVSGLMSKPVRSFVEIMDCLCSGSMSRVTASTNMNANSSRSHAIFTLTLTQYNQDQSSLISKLHFVDLAGSERLKRTGATGDRVKEGININQGLLCLGNVINALAESTSKKNVFIPYRDSKLTRLLQDSLGGNSQTLMIACISPSENDFAETLSTLVYANRAKNIKNKVSINQMQNTNSLQQEIAQLKRKISTLEEGNYNELDNRINELNKEVAALRSENIALRKIIKENLYDGPNKNECLENGDLNGDEYDIENGDEAENGLELDTIKESDETDLSNDNENLLEEEILNKERLMEEMIKQRSRDEELVEKDYCKKMEELTDRIKMIESERDSLLTALSKRQQKGLPSDEEKRKQEENKIRIVKDEYEKLSVKLDQYKALLDKKTDEYKRMLQENKKRENQINEFKNQLEDLRKQKAKLMREKQADVQRQRLAEIKHNRQIQIAQKDALKKDIQINNLLKQNEQASLIIKRKNEEMKCVQRMLKPIRTVSGAIRQPTNQPTGLPGQVSSMKPLSNETGSFATPIKHSAIKSVSGVSCASVNDCQSPFSSLPNNVSEKWTSIKSDMVRYLRFLECYHINEKERESILNEKRELLDIIDSLNKKIDTRLTQNHNHQSIEEIDSLKEQVSTKQEQMQSLQSRLIEIDHNLSQISDVPKPTFEQLFLNISFGEAIYHFQRLVNYFLKTEEERIRWCVANKIDYVLASSSPFDDFNDLTKSAKAKKIRRLTLVPDITPSK